MKKPTTKFIITTLVILAALYWGLVVKGTGDQWGMHEVNEVYQPGVEND